MDIESQKFMATFGPQTWAKAVVLQRDRINVAMGAMASSHQDSDLPWPQPKYQFEAERHLFLISSWRLIEHMDWCVKLGLPFVDKFDELNAMREDIKTMRDMNEHSIKYFLGKGFRQDEFMHVSDDAIADASSTVGTKIGNRLDWSKVANAASRLLQNVPETYYPAASSPSASA